MVRYTPFCLVSFRQSNPVLAWTVFGSVWGMTIAGIIFKVCTKRQFKYVTTATYLVMGWFGLLILKPLYHVAGTGGIFWLVLGGVLYSLETVK